MLLFRTSKVITLSTANTNVNLYNVASRPAEAINAIIFNRATANSSSNTIPAMRTGTGWKGGSTVHLVNSNTITGAAGTSGAGGTGGAGASVLTSPPGGAAFPGSSGGSGTSGGSSLTIDTITGLAVRIDNTNGTIIAGSGGSGGGGGGGGMGFL